MKVLKTLKKSIIFMVSMCFLTSTAYAQTGTYNGDSLYVDIGNGVGDTYSAQNAMVTVPYAVSPDGDYFTTISVSGSISSGGSWGFGYYDSSQQRHILSTYYSSPSGTYDLSGSAVGNFFLWVNNSNASGESYVYAVQAITNDGAVINFAKPSVGGGSSSPQSGGTIMQFPAPPSPPPPPDWNQVAQTFYNTWAANLPPIPSPPDPTQVISQTAPVGSDIPIGNTQLQTPTVDTPQEPPETGQIPFDLSQNQPTIQVDSSQSKPIQVQDPVANLPHDPVNAMPSPGNSSPSPFAPPNTPVLDAPSYSGTQTSGGGSTPPTPSAPSNITTPSPTQQPTTTGGTPTPTTPPPNTPASPNPTYNYP